MSISSVDFIRLVRSGWLTGRVGVNAAEKGPQHGKAAFSIAETLRELMYLANYLT